MHEWVKEFAGAVVVTDKQGIITFMNDRAIRNFEKEGGASLIGTNVLDCHSGPSHAVLETLMERQQKNIYTIEKNGIHKMIFQTPWYEEGEYSGFLELTFEIPSEMPHHVRD